MGSSQSKLPEPAVGEKLAERLRAMEVKETRSSLEKGYVYVDGEQRKSSSLVHGWKGLLLIDTCSTSVLAMLHHCIYQYG